MDYLVRKCLVLHGLLEGRLVGVHGLLQGGRGRRLARRVRCLINILVVQRVLAVGLPAGPVVDGGRGGRDGTAGRLVANPAGRGGRARAVGGEGRGARRLVGPRARVPGPGILGQYDVASCIKLHDL